MSLLANAVHAIFPPKRIKRPKFLCTQSEFIKEIKRENKNRIKILLHSKIKLNMTDMGEA